MRKISIMLIIVFLVNILLPLKNVYSLDYDGLVASLSSRNACSVEQFEVVMANSNGSLSSSTCHNTYPEAETDMNNRNSTATSVATIIHYISSDNKEIINTKYGMLDLRTTSKLKNPSEPAKNECHNTYLYGSKTATTNNNYMNGCYATDAPLLDYDFAAKRAKLKISGYTGWIKKVDADGRIAYNIVPISLAIKPTYYKVSSSGEIIHYLTKYVDQTNGYAWNWTTNLGVAPSFMQKNKNYYSYDGNYFYTNILTMIQDYKNNTYVNAVNTNSPFYNYYQYLPYRTRTFYDSADINNYLLGKGYTQKPLVYSDPMPSHQSMLYGEGPNFIQSQTEFGANALLSLALSINESGWGKSYIAVTNKNIFGHGAYDYDPAGSASSYSDVKYSILFHADIYVNSGYAHPQDTLRYRGSHFGNKASGMNIQYASDPYWGEKVASHYYNFDKAQGFLEHRYRIGLKKTMEAVAVKKHANTTSTTLYNLNAGLIDMAVVILDEVTGEAINGNNKWYKIQSDPPLDANRNVVPEATSDTGGPLYNWDYSYAYVHSSYIDVIGQTIERPGSFYLDKFEWNSTTQTINFRGFLIVQGINNSSTVPASYSLILKDVNDSSKEYIIPLDRWLDKTKYPFQIPSQDGYDYSSAWFNANISLTDIPQGDYRATVKAKINNAEATVVFRNMFSKPISTKIVDNEGRGYLFKTNYYIKDIPLEIFIRDNGLISSTPAPTVDNMFNTYYSIGFNGKDLKIRGTSFNVGGNYAKTQNVEREIILENTETFEQHQFTSNYIDNGDYPVVLKVADGLDKTRAWFDSTIDISSLAPGTYTIYIKTKTGNIDDYGELNDVFARTLNAKTIIADKTATLKLNNNKRMRIELVITQNEVINDVTLMDWTTNGIYLEGWSYARGSYPTSLNDIEQTLVFTDVNDANNRYEYTLDEVETCSISNITDCEDHNDFVGYKKALDLLNLPNGKYLITIETKVGSADPYNNKFNTSLDLLDRNVRAKIGNDEKLLTFEYETDGIYLNVEDFEYDYDIIIDVGHYYPATGAAYSDNDGIYPYIIERDLNYEVSKYEYDRYIAHGLNVFINKEHKDDVPDFHPTIASLDLDWEVLHKVAYTLGYRGVTAKIMYSNHHNSSSPTGSGYEIINPATYTSAQLAPERLIYNAWATLDPEHLHPSSLSGGFYTRDAYEPYDFYTKLDGQVYTFRNYYAVIRIPYEAFNTKLVIYEPVYMSNDPDFEWYYFGENWKRMSEIKIKHYVEALGYEYIPPTE